jgi:hypothetical protein
MPATDDKRLEGSETRPFFTDRESQMWRGLLWVWPCVSSTGTRDERIVHEADEADAFVNVLDPASTVEALIFLR